MLNKKIIGGTASAPATYVEDVFSTYLYTGTGANQTITNGIDLAGKGGLVWFKDRTNAGSTDYNHYLVSSGDSFSKSLYSNSTGASISYTPIQSVSSTGYVDKAGWPSGNPIVSWTFRKQPKFFDVVTYTGNGATERQINHSLGSAPGMVFVKSTSNSASWAAWHRSLGGTNYNMYLNGTYANAANGDFSQSGSGTMSSTSFCVSGGYGLTNENGQTYVAYLFAHNAGGFGAAGTDNVISCGTTTISGGTATVNLGYEAQYVLIKATNAAEGWVLMDVMRGMSLTDTAYLYAETTSAESNFPLCYATATGFNLLNLTSGREYIYMAIRRPMKVPTDATKVFKPVIATPSGSTTITTGFASDMLITTERDKSSITGVYVADRLRGSSTTAFKRLATNQTGAESNVTTGGFGLDSNSTVVDNYLNPVFGVGTSTVYWNFARRPGFFDEVCFDGSVVNTAAIPHNLTVVPELVICKKRSGTSNWTTFSSASYSQYLNLNTTAAYGSGVTWSATSTTVDLSSIVGSGTYVAYLFATCPGVSKVGSYTGTGATQTINCGFTGGARFVMIKSTTNASDWWVWDTARGMVAGTDPSLAFNTTDPEYNFNSVYTATTGFQLLASPGQGVNNSGENYIYLAIA